ncbi:MAG: RluA family pseudouridine synthase [Planctomycetota bacterium]
MSARPEELSTLLQCRVRPREAGVALLEFLATRFRYFDREAWRREIEAGHVAVDGRRGTPDRVVGAGTVVGTRRVLREPAVPTEVRVVHDAAGILVVDKPAGLPFHADGVFITHTLVAVLASRLGPGLEPLQRLDRETSGLCLFARERQVARALRAVGAPPIHKAYDAIARGVIEGDEFTVDAPIGLRGDSAVALRRGVLQTGAADARDARTSFRVLARGRDATLLRCVLHTGRTHQIRVHLESIGHPLVGDKLYGRTDDEYLAWVAHVKQGGDVAFDGRFGAPRQMLHARRLELVSPLEGTALRLDATWPDDFRVCASEHGIVAPE